ncbi:hypothetical protein [Brachybacterium tyrofermentans]|uniref:hypothetical protein n=1 Tax=Brachybacterium tyrofermentans TaxID=47848 RepID=UPI001867A97A|nr:hypothetical protein [Brachybacterium tyrofermentans]
MHALTNRFGITEQTHIDCPYCTEQAHDAVTAARVTGSRGATHTKDSTDGQQHSATVIRLHNTIEP